MTYFITFNEGGYFIAVEARDASPEGKVKYLSNGSDDKFIALFKDGSCFDGFLGRWRGAKKENIRIYNELINNKDVPKINLEKHV